MDSTSVASILHQVSTNQIKVSEATNLLLNLCKTSKPQNKVIEKLAEDAAMDFVFCDRPCNTHDWEYLLSRDFKDIEGFQGFKPSELFIGYTNDWIVGYLRQLKIDHVNMFKKAFKNG